VRKWSVPMYRTRDSTSCPTAFLIACLAKAVDEHKAVQAYRKGRNQLILFEDVDVNTQIEHEVEGGRPLNKVFKTRSGVVRGSLASGVVDEFEMKARVNVILNRHPTVGLAMGVVRNGSLEFFYGHGLANITSNTPITEDTVFRIGSITKTFTAIAVMQLWEQGLVDLDAPANDYLRAYRLTPASPSFRPTTLRQLLTHTGGIPEQVPSYGLFLPDYGESVKLGRRVPSLAEYYRGSLRVAVEPGTMFIYGDHGIATLGQIVEDVSGKPLDRYFRDHIFEPLGMADTDLLRSEHVQSRLATGYKLGSGGPKAITDRQLVPAAAGAIYSTTGDMARYVAALLGGGSNEHGSVLKPATLASMFEPHYQADPRVPGMGLGFFRGNLGGHPTVEHQGILPGFNSQIWLAPNDGVGVLAFTNGASNAVMWMPAELGELLGHLLSVPAEGIRTDVPQRPEIWKEICGWYSLSVPITDARSRLYIGAGAEVLARRGELIFRLLSPIPAMSRGFPLVPDDENDPYVFRIDFSRFGMGSTRVLFGREPGGGMTMVPELGVMPLPLRKQPSSKNPRLWATAALAVTGTGLTLRRFRATRKKRLARNSHHGDSHSAAP
jgi:CubicO group peptidase (beta-lactamase class C family)